jgi:hypothetical protein
MRSGAPHPDSAGERTPYALLVGTGLAALALGAAAFLLWGTQGGAWLLDLIAAYCG